MRIMIFDTETSGLDPNGYDILQLSYQVIGDRTFRILREENYYFPWPENRLRVNWGAINVNGLTESFLATQRLYDRRQVLTDFAIELSRCNLCVAHNGEFDMNFINATAYRLGMNEIFWPKMIDTMKSTTDLCRLPSCGSHSGYKWPKLIELAEFLGVDTSGMELHDSSADVEITKRCFLRLLSRGFY